MKGIILAGGYGTRLRPLTDHTNKHLLPICGRPMIHYPIECLRTAGITDVIIVTGEPHLADFRSALPDARALGLASLTFAAQQGAGGIADALLRAEPHAKGHNLCVLLGDNIMERTIRPTVEAFAHQKTGARFILATVDDPRPYGVAEFNGAQLIRIIEKPATPPSNRIVIGAYLYDADAFDLARTLTPSPRGELEITDLNNLYIARNSAEYDPLRGWWTDAGTIEHLRHAEELINQTGANNP